MKTSKKLEQAIENGITVTQAQFHTAVNNSDKVPDTVFDTASTKSTRQVQMWLTSMGLVCLHKEDHKKVKLKI